MVDLLNKFNEYILRRVYTISLQQCYNKKQLYYKLFYKHFGKLI